MSHPKTKKTELKVLTYNIHQGVTLRRSRLTFQKLRDHLFEIDCDLLFLQEVAGNAHRQVWQLKELECDALPYTAYQKNVNFPKSFYGNALLSKFPIVDCEMVNLSLPRLKSRGCILAEIKHPEKAEPIHVVTLHLGLLEYERVKQLITMARKIENRVSKESALILGGDFNDWRQRLSTPLETRLKLKEAFFHENNKHAKTFPSRLPLLPLDRIYFRHVKLKEVKVIQGPIWRKLSDHLPLLATFEL